MPCAWSNRSHRWAVAAAGAAMAHVVAAGHALDQARDLCEEEGWLRWSRTNFEGSVRTVQRYMRVARHLPASAIDATRVSHRSQTALLRALRGVVLAIGTKQLNAVLPASSSILDDFAHARVGPAGLRAPAHQRPNFGFWILDSANRKSKIQNPKSAWAGARKLARSHPTPGRGLRTSRARPAWRW